MDTMARQNGSPQKLTLSVCWNGRERYIFPEKERLKTPTINLSQMGSSSTLIKSNELQNLAGSHLALCHRVAFIS